ncbi:MAG: permease, partial [Clostridiales bacterium]|nr:permease [Clostridiales bacterium]
KIVDGNIIVLGRLIPSTMKVYIDPKKIQEKLMKYNKAGISSTILLGALTTLSASGSMAVILSFILTKMPWGPVMAFLVSSPLTSPAEYMFEGAFMGWQFANWMLASSILLGLIAGATASYLEKNTKFLHGQFRLSNKPQPEMVLESFPISTVQEEIEVPKINEKHKQFLIELWETGIKKIFFYFILFVSIGKTIEYFIPLDGGLPFLSSSNPFAPVIGASIGLPLYINFASALPLLKSLSDIGASQGAIMAFLIAGKATGIPVIVGMLPFMRARALAFYVTFVWLGAMITGYLFQVVL